MIRRIAMLLCLLIVAGCARAPGAGPIPTPPPSHTSAAPPIAPSPAATDVPVATVVPSETPSPGPTPTVTPIPGWLTFHNEQLGYTFDYPPEGALSASGVTGYPTEELPTDMTPADYMAHLSEQYPGDLCVSLGLATASLSIRAPDDKGGKYADPCGVSGVGVYDLRSKEETFTVGGAPCVAKGTELYKQGTTTLEAEFYIIRLDDGTRIDLAGNWAAVGKTNGDYLAEKELLLRVLASLRWGP